jgi:cell wall-associated NlpC family hydrolase
VDPSTDDFRVTARRVILSLLTVGLVLGFSPGIASAAPTRPSERPAKAAALAQLDITSLIDAATAIEQQALTSGAMTDGPDSLSPAQILLSSVEALTSLAITDDPSLAPTNTTAVMGPVPPTIAHHLHKRPRHFHIKRTRTLGPFAVAVPDGGSAGLGHNRPHGGSMPAPYQARDRIFVDPTLWPATPATVGLVAVRAALRELGQPYVWGGAGPRTFDCSGLVQWAYAQAGLRMVHHAADQWNEGRLIPGRDILPGDLIMFGRPIFHVGIYLGAGWMINAPYTGQYVDIVTVPSGVTGVVRP